MNRPRSGPSGGPRIAWRRLGLRGPSWMACLVVVLAAASGVIPQASPKPHAASLPSPPSPKPHPPSPRPHPPNAWSQASGTPGLTAAAEVAHAYDVILDADFDGVESVLEQTCGPAPPVACQDLRALAIWWDIVLDPESRALDARFTTAVETAIADAEAWTEREPERAEAWFYLGAALGARSQWQVLRDQRLSAARAGKRIKAVMERALALDPALHDAEFGLGVYRYYAGVAPAYLRWLRWLLQLPGGNRDEGLAQMERASRLGRVVAAEADYQLHLVYLWYERRVPDALEKITSLGLRYPRNPQFQHLAATIHDVYRHDPRASLAASETLLALAARGEVHRAPIAAARARLNIAVQLDRLGERTRAMAMLETLLNARESAPRDAVRDAERLRRAWMAR